MKPIAQIAVIALAIPGGLWLAFKVAGLDKLRQLGTAAGKKFLTDPIQGGAKRVSGSIAHWGAGRGFIGRTAARLATGSIYPGGRAQMERIGEAHRKASGERDALRGGYRARLSARSGVEALERTSAEAIASLAERAYGGDGRAMATLTAMQRMAHDSRARLSDAQRNALYGGSGATYTEPTTGLPSANPIPQSDSPRTSPRRFGEWFTQDRPDFAPGRRQANQRFGGAVMRWAGDWGRWAASPFRTSTRTNQNGTTDRVWPRYRP